MYSIVEFVHPKSFRDLFNGEVTFTVKLEEVGNELAERKVMIDRLAQVQGLTELIRLVRTSGGLLPPSVNPV